MNDQDILKMDGVVIRLIPKTTTRHRISYKDGKKVVTQDVSKNSLGGKYLLTFCDDQGSTIRMSQGRDGIGDTIQLAYADYLKKNGG